MTAPWLADAVTSNIAGQEEATCLLQSLRIHCGTGDELFVKTLALAELGDIARFRGFCRALQKTIERIE